MDFEMWFLENLQLVAVHLCGTCIVSDFLVLHNHVISSGLVEIWLYNVDVLLIVWWTLIFPISYYSFKALLYEFTNWKKIKFFEILNFKAYPFWS